MMSARIGMLALLAIVISLVLVGGLWFAWWIGFLAWHWGIVGISQPFHPGIWMDMGLAFLGVALLGVGIPLALSLLTGLLPLLVGIFVVALLLLAILIGILDEIWTFCSKRRSR